MKCFKVNELFFPGIVKRKMGQTSALYSARSVLLKNCTVIWCDVGDDQYFILSAFVSLPKRPTTLPLSLERLLQFFVTDHDVPDITAVDFDQNQHRQLSLQGIYLTAVLSGISYFYIDGFWIDATRQPFVDKNGSAVNHERKITKYNEIIVPTFDERRYAFRPHIRSAGGLVTDGDGFRSNSKPQSDSRCLLFLGDSMVMGAKIEDNNKLFAELVAQSFTLKFNKIFHSVNGGCSSYIMRQVLAALVTAAKHKPALVFLHAPVNDVTLGAQLGAGWTEGATWINVFGFDVKGQSVERPILDQTKPVPKEAIISLKKYALFFVKFCAQHNIPVIMVTAPRLLHNEYSEEYICRVASLGIDITSIQNKEYYLGRSIDEVNEVFRSVAALCQIPVVDLAHIMDSCSQKHLLFVDYFHLSLLGHMFVANELTNSIHNDFFVTQRNSESPFKCT